MGIYILSRHDNVNVNVTAITSRPRCIHSIWQDSAVVVCLWANSNHRNQPDPSLEAARPGQLSMIRERFRLTLYRLSASCAAMRRLSFRWPLCKAGTLHTLGEVGDAWDREASSHVGDALHRLGRDRGATQTEAFGGCAYRASGIHLASQCDASLLCSMHLSCILITVPLSF